MFFGKNLQFLRKMSNGMTQEELAVKMEVSRQTISKWELETAYPEMDKVMELCRLFSCTMDNLFREDMNVSDECYSRMRVEEVEGFRYVSYAVISREPEEDAIGHVTKWGKSLGVEEPEIIGWDFPMVSQEQINVYHMHGYAAAWILPEDAVEEKAISGISEDVEVREQKRQRYAAITIAESFKSPFVTIPNAYKTLMAYMNVNGLEHKMEKDVIACFEKSYHVDGVEYMDVYIAVK